MKHHYIPQFYLRPWLGTDNKLTEFRRLHLPRDTFPRLEVKRRGTKETGWERNLYCIPGATVETKDNVERLFMGVVDARAAAARDMLLRGEIPGTNELRLAWSRFLLSLLVRTPDEVRRLKRNILEYLMMPDLVFQAKYDEIRKDDWPEKFEDYIQIRNPRLAERSAILMTTNLIQNENILRTFMNARWWVLDISTVSRRLMTSDHPLVMTNGLNRLDGHFGLPIGPQHLFVAFMHEDFSERFRRTPVGKIVRWTNDAVIGQGRKSVYGLNRDNAAEVKRRMGKRDYMLPIPRDAVVIDEAMKQPRIEL